MSVITVKNLQHRYGDLPSLHSVSLDCPTASITCLLGPSGCGKSTLLRCIAGHEQPTGGEISLGDRLLVSSARSLAPEARNVGMVFQDYALFPHLRVWQNIAFGLRALPRKEQKQRAFDTMERLELSEFAERYPYELSGGQQQRVALARALAVRPRALLLDEPFSGLDTSLRDALRLEVRELLLKEDIPTIMVTHDPEEALCCADHIVLMRDGKIVQAGTPDELWHHPIDADAMAFFTSVFRMPATVKAGVCSSTLGQWDCEDADGEYELVLRSEALVPDPTGDLKYQINAQPACGGHRHVTIATPDGGCFRLRVPNHGPLTQDTKWKLDRRMVKLFAT